MTEKQAKKVFVKQVKPIVSILRKSVTNKTALLDRATVSSDGKVLTFSFTRAPHRKKSLYFFVGQYGAAVPLPACLSNTAGDVFTDAFQCKKYVERLIKAAS